MAKVKLWVIEHILNLTSAYEIAIVAILFWACRFLSYKIKGLVVRYRPNWHFVVTMSNPSFRQAIFLVLLIPTFSVSWLISEAWDNPGNTLEIISILAIAWSVIRLTSGLIEPSLWSRFSAAIIWAITALHLMGLLKTTTEFLAKISFRIGEVQISLLQVASSLIVFTLLFWLVHLGVNISERRLQSSRTLTPSQRVLLVKLLKIGFVSLAIIFGLNITGLDLTSIAIFSGAIGLGIAVGLQKVSSNLISGFILLLDRSIKPGNVISVGNTYGYVSALEARYVAVVTRDGKKHLIPNEDLITQSVENWSYKDNKVRIRIPIQVSYETDIEKAMELTVAAAKNQERILPSPGPVCRIRRFGESGINLELSVWIEDPIYGVGKPRSDVLLAVWKVFQQHNIRIPYPKAEVSLVSFDEAQADIVKKNE